MNKVTSVRNQDIKIEHLNPKVSIVLPTHNGARYLRQAIQSCLNQTHKNIEIIIVDDCSTDTTPKIIQSFSDARIRYVRNEKNQRLPRSLNIGFALATGEYLTWTSDDNEFLPQAIETMLKVLLDDETIDFVYSDYAAKYLETGETRERRFSGVSIKEKNCVGTCFLYTHRVYETIGGFDPKYELVEDYEYWIRVWQKFSMCHIPQLLYIYGEHRKSLKGTRITSIDLFDKVLKYRYGFIKLAQLGEQINRFLTISIDCRESTKKFIDLWLHTLRRMFSLSVRFGIFFFFFSLHRVLIRTTGYAIKKSLWPVRKFIMQRRIRGLVQTLKKNKDKTNILCAVPAMTLGGAQKVVLSIAAGLKLEGNFSFNLVATKRANQHLQKSFSAYFDNIIAIDPLPDEDLYEYYYSRIVAELGIDILLVSHPIISYKFIPQLKTRFKHLKVIDILHLERVGGTKAEMSWLVPYMDKRVCISHQLQRHMVGTYNALGVDNGYAKRLVTIHNGIDLTRYKNTDSLKGSFKSKFHLADDTKLISFIARFAVEKQPFLFIDIARSLIQKDPPVPVKFVMAGDGYLSKQVKERISQYGLEAHFILTGALENVQELLADTHLFLLTSNHEGIPLTVMEALAMNIPVVSTVVGAVEEILTDGLTGYLIAPTTDMKDKFTSKVLDILGNESLYRSLSMNTKSSLSTEYSLVIMADRYRQVFDELMTSGLEHTERNSARKLSA